MGKPDNNLFIYFFWHTLKMKLFSIILSNTDPNYYKKKLMMPHYESKYKEMPQQYISA